MQFFICLKTHHAHEDANNIAQSEMEVPPSFADALRFLCIYINQIPQLQTS